MTFAPKYAIMRYGLIIDLNLQEPTAVVDGDFSRFRKINAPFRAIYGSHALQPDFV